MEGFANHIVIGKESTWGTAVVPAVAVPILPSDGIQIETNTTGVEAIKTTQAKNKLFFLGKRTFVGGYEFNLYPIFLTHILKSVFGSDTVTEPEAGVVYKHTFAESTSQMPLTVEQKIGDIVRRYNGYVVKNFKLSGKVGELLTMTIDGVGKGQASASAVTPSYETSKPLKWNEVSTISVGGTDIKGKIEEFELEYDNGLNMFHGFGNLDAAAKYVTPSEAKGSIKCFVDSTTAAYLTDLIAGTEAELIITITGTDTIGSASNNVLKFTLSKCVWTKSEQKLDFDYNALTLNFEARLDSTNGLIKTELTNLQATI